MGFTIKYTLPTRLFCDGDKKMISWRLPEKLLKELESVAKDSGWTTTDVVTSALDEYVQLHKKMVVKLGHSKK